MTDGDDSVREVRISCSDATGLGCDVARLLLDFGLRILSGKLGRASPRQPALSLENAAYLRCSCGVTTVSSGCASTASTATCAGSERVEIWRCICIRLRWSDHWC